MRLRTTYPELDSAGLTSAGQGVQFARKLRKLNVPNVIDVNGGKRCFLTRNKDRFINQSAGPVLGARGQVGQGWPDHVYRQ